MITKTIKITRVTDETIEFSDNSFISFEHCQDCCEYNYADFQQLEDEAKEYSFQLPLKFEEVEGSGFRFGDSRRMFFVPCYSEQNGYYSTDICVYYSSNYNGTVPVLNVECELMD